MGYVSGIIWRTSGKTKNNKNKTFLQVIPTPKRFSDIVSDILYGSIYHIYSDIVSDILSGIPSSRLSSSVHWDLEFAVAEDNWMHFWYNLETLAQQVGNNKGVVRLLNMSIPSLMTHQRWDRISHPQVPHYWDFQFQVNKQSVWMATSKLHDWGILGRCVSMVNSIYHKTVATIRPMNWSLQSHMLHVWNI